MKSLADLRATKDPSRPERSVTLCLKPHLVAEVQALTAELAELPAEQSPEDDTDDAPRKMANPEVSQKRARAAEIRDQLAALLEEMGEFSGEMRLRANLTDGEWRRWCDAHPARDEGKPGYDRDQRVSYGYCDSDALLDDLGTFAVEWNGEPLAPGDWSDVFEPKVGSADKAEMARAVVAMYESRVDFRQWRTGLQGNLKRLNGFASLVNSGSATSDSTAGSPDESRSDTTETGTE